MTITTQRDATNDQHWQEFTHEWLIRADTTYLNHGSFGPPPQRVRQRRREWIDKLDAQPMDFYLRTLEPALAKTKNDLAGFLGTDSTNLVLAENSTYAMNIVADSFLLEQGDEVLLNNHEYGAVHRIWNRACERVGATTNVARLPDQFESAEQIVECLLEAASEKTKLVIVSHITSPTALIMPIEQICAAFKQREVTVLVDGPHAPAQVELNINNLECDFYTASCHKWLSASLGSGFLYASPKWHDIVKPQIQSWGRLLPAQPEQWYDEFIWNGTRDPSAYLSISAAIEYMSESIGLDTFRERSRFLARQAEDLLCDEFGTIPIGGRNSGWYGSMAHVPLPSGDHSKLQVGLWQEYGIEIPIIDFEGLWYVRVSCHMYNNQKQLESLKFAITKFLI